MKQVKVSDLEDDILELPEDDPAAANNQSVIKHNNNVLIMDNYVLVTASSSCPCPVGLKQRRQARRRNWSCGKTASW